MNASAQRPNDHNAFCSFLKKQAVLDHVPHHIYGHRCASSYMRSNNLLETPVGMDAPRLRDGVTLPDTIYYTVRLHGDRGSHPTRKNINDLQAELAGIFKSAGFEEMPIACSTQWKADAWERQELERFDEVVPSGHGQEARCEEQKYQRTKGDTVLSYPFPASRFADLQHAISAVEIHRQQHCSVGK